MSELQYSSGDTVFALDGGRTYKAKVLKSQIMDGATQYFIHYDGWNRRWDKWVKSSELTSTENSNESSASKSADNKLKSSVSSSLKKKAKGSVSGEDDDVVQSRKKRKQLILNDLEVENESDSPEENKPQLKLEFPFALKKHLVDEWEMITQEPLHLHKLPRPESVTVAKLLQDFLAYKQKKIDEQQMEQYKELMDGLRLYFDKSLPLVLLYRQERDQVELINKLYGDSSNNNSPSLSPLSLSLPSSEIYGTEHLLRLFLRLPQLFTSASLSLSEINHVQTKLVDLLKYIQKHSDLYILKHEYGTAEEVINKLQLTLREKETEKEREKEKERENDLKVETEKENEGENEKSTTVEKES